MEGFVRSLLHPAGYLVQARRAVERWQAAVQRGQAHPWLTPFSAQSVLCGSTVGLMFLLAVWVLADSGPMLAAWAGDSVYSALEECHSVPPPKVSEEDAAWANKFVHHRADMPDQPEQLWTRKSAHEVGVCKFSADEQARSEVHPPPGLRIYVYEVPDTFTVDLLDAPIDINTTSMADIQRLSSGGLEVAFHKYLLQDKSGRVTADPEEADLFFVPFYASNSYKTKELVSAGLYQRLVEHVRAQAGGYWDRYGGHDHVLVLGRHWTQRTAFGRSSMQMVHKDHPILLTFEFTNHKAADMARDLWRMARSVIIPRPDPFAELSSSRCPEGSAPPPNQRRPYLVAYLGSQISTFRRRLVAAMQEFGTPPAISNPVDGSLEETPKVYVNAFCREERLQVSERLQRGEVAGMDAPFLYRMSDFCPCPRGDSHTDSRLYDAIRAGCIPVLFDWV